MVEAAPENAEQLNGLKINVDIFTEQAMVMCYEFKGQLQ